MTIFLAVVALLALFDLLATRYGADTRDGRDWTPRSDVGWTWSGSL
jgi:hypothetical protein